MNDGSRTWVKICANTSLEDAQVAVDAGADAVGFVFAPSPRRVTAEQVAAIAARLPAGVEKIGVFVDATFEELCSAVDACRLTGVQLHSESVPSQHAQLRRRFGPQLRILQVVHFGPDAAEQAQTITTDPEIDGILVDSRTATVVGGTGEPFNWTEAREGVFGGQSPVKLIAAGGLTPENVREAIAILRPWGVDVASGVEAVPGRKDPEKVRQFVANVRASGRVNSAS
jgi:phosphoribosylanthranilate isomerase